MGTDIFFACEVRKNGVWQPNDKPVFRWFEDSIVDPPCKRVYNLFAILADVRNGYGFAGCYTGTSFNPISEWKGLPEDITEESKEKLFPDGYGESYYTLTELLDYDWTQKHIEHGIVEYSHYMNTIAKGRQPSGWCGGVGGGSTVIIQEDELPDRQEEIEKDEEGLKYFVECDFPAETYAESVGTFYTEVIPALKELVPEGGTTDDVRIIFNFDC